MTPDPPDDGSERPSRVVVVGASAGGVEALIAFARSLPADIDAAILVVLHISALGTSVLPSILDRASPLPVYGAVDGARLRKGEIYVAPPDHHMLLEDSRIALAQTPRENGHRPAIDPSMRSAAAAFGPAVTGVVLSGTRDDGTAGLLAIKTAGGTAVVQDPKDAVYSAMPQSAIDHVEVDAVLPVAQIGAWLRDTPARHDSETSPQPMATITNSGIGEPAGEGTRYTCPDCGGVLFADEEGTLPRFGCSVGHVFSIESLENAQAAVLESALWAAVRSLEDRADLLQRIAARYKSDELRGRHLRDEARFALERAETIRATIEQPQGSGGPPQSAEPAA